MKISQLDHIVLTVGDIDATVAFYCSVLGMTPEIFGEGRVALKFGQQKINLHLYGNEFEPKADKPMPGAVDLCLITETPLEQAMLEVKSKGILIEEGPVTRTGATGPILSFYIRDLDNNLIEIANYQ